MTDFELNKAIAELICDGQGIECRSDSVFFINNLELGDAHAHFNPCNNWNDLMPLVVEYNLLSDLSEIGFLTETQLRRALAERLLRVLESENERI